MPSTVPAMVPPSTPVPTAFWLPEPAPVAIASGSTPRPNASEVIRMGRRRMRTACRVASMSPLPSSSINALANSTIRIAFFDESPMVARRPTWKYTSLDNPRPLAASSAPNTPSGTTRITAKGTDQLS